MIGGIKQWYPIFSIMGMILLFDGCNESGWSEKSDVLIRAGQYVVTKQDFSDAFEIAKVAYPHNAMQDDVLIREIRLSVLDQLSDEAVLLERANALQITVSDAEIESVISKIKSGYPDESFQHAFLQSAISYKSWVKRLKNRLIMEKVIKKDLENRIEITLEDITDFINIQDQVMDNQQDSQKEDVKIDKTTIDFLRREKAEKSYRQWINELKQKYPLVINEDLWGKISGL